MKKRGLAMLLALSMGVGMLSGCSIGSSGAGAGLFREGRARARPRRKTGQKRKTVRGRKTEPGRKVRRPRPRRARRTPPEAMREIRRSWPRCCSISATMSYPQVKEQTGIALDQGLTPLEIREAIYQTASYAGYQKAINAMAYADEMFAERGIEIPLESQATVTDEDRYEKGLEAQRAIFGPDFAAITEDMSESMKRRVSYVSLPWEERTVS